MNYIAAQKNIPEGFEIIEPGMEINFQDQPDDISSGQSIRPQLGRYDFK